MSLLDDILDVGGSLWKSFTGPGTGAAIARATALSYLLKEVTESINKENQTPAAAASKGPDPTARLQVNPDTENAIPVVYGDAFLGGIVTDARLVNNNETMWYCLTICEKTGTKLSDSAASALSFQAIYWDNNLVSFQSDGITVASFTDETGAVDTTVNGLIKIYCYNAGSVSPVVPAGYTNGSLSAAYAVMPNWTSQHLMTDLAFALVRIDYNAENFVRGLGKVEFKMRNTMNQPGDCLYDYLTNTRYGAGIDPSEIKTS